MKIHCANCHQSTCISQDSPYHAGFSSRGFLYSDQASAILVFSAYNSNYVRVVGDQHPWSLNELDQQKLEAALKPCPAGGRFRFSALPRCPHCQRELEGLLADRIHYVELGVVIDGDVEDVWSRALWFRSGRRTNER